VSKTISSQVYDTVKTFIVGDQFVTEDLMDLLDLHSYNHSAISGTLYKLVKTGMVKISGKKKASTGKSVYTYEVIDLNVKVGISDVPRPARVPISRNCGKRIPLELGDAPHAIKYQDQWYLCRLVEAIKYGIKDDSMIWSEEKTNAYICRYEQTEKRVRLE
jgi:hypothetical protein